MLLACFQSTLLARLLHYKMARLQFALLLTFLVTGGDAFVTRPFVTTTTQQSKLMAIDPIHLFDSASTLLADGASDYIPGTSGDVSYSRASYYTILGLYLTSFPGLWSTIKRSTSAKIKRKTYVTAGEKATGGKGLRDQAGEIMAYMKANNYEVADAGETITFKGVVKRSLSQAFFLVFVTAMSMVTLALVLNIQFNELELPGIGKPNWYFLALVSPYAGIYYWSKGDRVDEISFKLEVNDDETENSILVQGSEEEIERMWRQLEWQEKGMIKVSGLLDVA